jgi:hypothetical protein
MTTESQIAEYRGLEKLIENRVLFSNFLHQSDFPAFHLYMAIRSSNKFMIIAILDTQLIDINRKYNDWTFIALAIRYSTTEIVQLLADRGADVNNTFGKDNLDILVAAACSRDPVQKIKFLQPSIDKWDPIMILADRVGPSFFDEQCGICLDNMGYSICKMECGHHFHINCLSFANVDKCPICSKRSCNICNSISNDLLVRTECSHQFHLNCLKKIAKETHCCPTCREVL